MPGLDRKLTLYGLTMIAVGLCIGSGIFVTPYEVAAAVPHQGIILLVWILGGLIALTGALTFAELGGMFPTAGGVYVFLREAYGPFAVSIFGTIGLYTMSAPRIYFAMARDKVFVLISTAFVLNTLYQRPAQAWAGLFMLGLGMATFRLFRYK
jgi:APA family basic amino acid/polyamine antiporter